MGIRDIIDKWKNRKSRLNEALEDYRIQKMVEERQKSANERELERFMKEEREDSIKKELEEFRSARQQQAQYGNQILGVKNVFAHDKSSILKQPSIMKNDSKQLKGRKLFFK